MRFFLFCVAGLMAVESLHAGLAWETNLLELSASPSDDTVEGVYRFKNTGTTPVSIRRVINSCGCTATRYEKKAIAPGESGELKAEFEIGSRRGLQKKTIEVRTDDGESMRLGLYVNVEETVAMDRRILFWKKGDPSTTRSITLTVSRNEPMQIERVESTDPTLRTELETVEPGRKYRLHVTPTAMDAAISGMVNMVAAGPEGAQQKFPVRVRIR